MGTTVEAMAHFYFVGERSYVQGTTTFRRCLETAIELFGRKSPDTIVVEQFAMKHELTMFDATIAAAQGSSSEVPGDQLLVARLHGKSEAQAFTVSVYEDKSRPIVERRSGYNEKELVNNVTLTGDCEGSACLCGIQNPVHLVRSVVEANKQIHVQHLEGMNPRIRWVSLSGMELPMIWKDAVELDATFRRMGSSVLQRSRFTRNRVEIQGAGQNLSADICFKYDLTDS